MTRWIGGIVMALSMLTSCQGEAQRGVEALRAGDATTARQLLQIALDEAGDDAPLAWHIDHALAALAVGDDDAALASVERSAVARGDDRGLADFVRGVVSYRRALAIERETAGGGEMAAFDPAVLHAQAAVAAWTRALRTRADWPQARRNIERARELLERAARATSSPPPPDESEDEDVPDEEADEEDVELPAHLTELPPSRVRSLLDLLARKERDKAALREQEQRRRTSGGRDW